MFSYQYHSLYGDEIRLLRCIPDHISGAITFTLTRHSLRDAPKYYALSYTWDDPLGKERNGIPTRVDHTSNQQLSAEPYHKHRPSESPHNGDAAFTRRGLASGPEFGKFMIRPNLMAALRILSKRYPEAYLWVDAVCINQADVQERNAQITRMYRIYENAAKVIAWLGPKADNSDIALDFIRDVASRSDEPQLHLWLARTADDPAYERQWHAICALYSRKWWKRVWIIQETAASEIVEIFCGTSALHWSHLSIFQHTVSKAWMEFTVRFGVQQLQVFEKGYNDIACLNDLRDSSLLMEELSLFEVLRATYKSDAADPRDKLYAVLGLTYDGNDLVPRANYNKSTQDVFANVTINFIKMYSTLDIISLAGGTPLTERVVSWLPDLSRTAEFKLRLNIGFASTSQYDPACFDACKQHFARACFPQDFGVLRCKGIYVDEVDGLAEAPWGSRRRRGSIKARYQMSRYRNSREVAKAIWRTFVTDRRYGNGYVMKAPREFVKHLVRKCTSAEHLLESYDTRGEGDYQHRKMDEFEMVYRDNRWFEVAGKPIREWIVYLASQTRELPHSEEVPSEWLESSVLKAQDRHRLCTTNTGYLGTVPYWTRPGDMVCVLFGHAVPVLLRQVGRQYRYVGDCYFHGIMHGEAVDQLDRGELQSEWFDVV